jgi:hypothetical protein
VLQKAIFCASAAHVPKRTFALRFSNITFFADCQIMNQNEYITRGVSKARRIKKGKAEAFPFPFWVASNA